MSAQGESGSPASAKDRGGSGNKATEEERPHEDPDPPVDGSEEGEAAPGSVIPSEALAEDEQVLEGIMEDLPPERREQLIQIVARSHKGPLPDPGTFAAYEAALPGTGQAIVTGARDYRHHKMAMDRKLANTARLSLILTFIAVLALFALAGWFASQGQEWLAGFFGIAGIAPVFVGMLRGGGRWSGQ